MKKEFRRYLIKKMRNQGSLDRVGSSPTTGIIQEYMKAGYKNPRMPFS